MNWIIKKTVKTDFHTHLDIIIAPIKADIISYNWILSDLEINYLKDLPVNHEDEYFILSPTEFEKMLGKDVQIIWGVIIAVPMGIKIEILDDKFPYSEGNDLAWQNGNIQYPDGKIEIICFDSSLTIVKFADKPLSDKFKAYFGDEAIDLEKPGKIPTWLR
ncbi:MAG: hypothetical protein V4456_01745 [Bacteroidota bacterium]